MGLYKTSTDKSWLTAYDQYLKSYHTESQRLGVDLTRDPVLMNTLMTSYDGVVATNFHVAKMKRPVQHIYKRPI